MRVLIPMMLVVAAATCGGSGGNAERVNVLLSVTVTLTQAPTRDCHSGKCSIHYRVVVTDEGTQAVYARDCVVRALDPTGRTILQTSVIVGFPAGGYTEPGAPFQGEGALPHPMPRQQAARISALSGSCSAYVWHGTPPI